MQNRETNTHTVLCINTRKLASTTLSLCVMIIIHYVSECAINLRVGSITNTAFQVSVRIFPPLHIQPLAYGMRAN